MAKLPPLKRILREEINEAPSWVNKLLIPLNSFMQNVFEALNGDLTLEDNIAAKVVDINYNSGAITRLANPFDRPVKAILLGAIGGGPVTGGVTPVWQEVNNVIEIRDLAGLASGNTYRVRLIIL